MNQLKIEQEISIIKIMIEKTRRETAESGVFFIALGFLTAITTFAMGMLDLYHIHHLNLAILIGLTVVNGIIAFLIIQRESKTARVKSYAKTLFYSTWFAIAVPLILITFVLPFINVIPAQAIPVLAALLIGAAFFISGVIYEMKFLIWCSLAWWTGACLMAVIDSPYRFLILVAVILIGWVTPGFILNYKYKNRSAKDEA
ncbi:hypothetical protein JXO59_04155 [candidate division KSB1 bacterium]|nr:hypothetical protein [candidate division KSB1 bacterium]